MYDGPSTEKCSDIRLDYQSYRQRLQNRLEITRKEVLILEEAINALENNPNVEAVLDALARAGIGGFR